MMGKLVPTWGQSAQPGKTYYYQKLSHDIFGVVNSSLDQRYVFVKDELIGGDKNSDHVCSYLSYYVDHILPDAIKRIKVYLDSATYFKTKYLMWWAAEQISKGRFKRVRFSFMVPGHTTDTSTRRTIF